MSDVVFEQKKAKYLEFRKQFADEYPKKSTTQEVSQMPEGTQAVASAGRIVGLRTMGKLIFAHIFDFSGKVQISVNKTEENPELFESFVNLVNVGDFVGVEGEVFITKKGETTLRVQSFKILNKCLRTLPEKYHGVEDIETRYRQRYLDIIMNEKSRNVFAKRISTVRSLRAFLESNRFLEVETPVLQTQPSGALARPFHTKHNALDIPCVLRIAPETYLKRCIGAGMDKVFEFARCFRNEGVSATHLQDFTMLEFYAAYWNAEIMRDFVSKMIRNLVTEVFGSPKVTIHETEIDFSGEWPVLDYCNLILKDCEIDIKIANTKELLLEELKQKNIFLEDIKSMNWANTVDTLYKKVSRPKLIQPCFIVKYPTEMAPLARKNIQDENFVDLFQFLVAGVEIVKAYSELVDPLDQRIRFEEQTKAKEAGDEETMPLDEDFLLSMEHGLPPISGVGIGIDRLVMVLCGCENIKDTVLFPLLKPIH
jgi:lysyl-tRNA synthetase, class II